MKAISTAAGPRAWRPQFSLRLLLLVLTAFGIGFPIWYRWPYEAVTDERDSTGRLMISRTTTLQRQWGGKSLLHGPSREVLGDFTITTHYVRGIRNGPYSLHDAKGRTSETGHYVDGWKEGVWLSVKRGGKSTATYLHDQLVGDVEIEHPKRGKVIATFATGRLTHFNGQPVQDHLFELLQSSALDERTRNELVHDTEIDVVEMPIKDVVIFLADKHGIPFILDAQRVPAVDLPLTGYYSGLDLASTLKLLTVPHDLGCDYRYGCLWITTAEDAKDWHDPTGVADIKPAKGSALARAWNEPATFDAVNMPLADALAQVVQRLAIEIDARRLTPTPQNPAPILVTASVRGLPFRDVLGILLYNAGCRCKLEGENLVILPPRSESP